MTEPTDLDALIAVLRKGDGNGCRQPTEAMRTAAEHLDELQEELRQERERADDLEDRLSGYLCDSTGGKLSKTGYDVRTMVSHTEEYYDDIHAEDRKVVEADLARAREVIENVRTTRKQADTSFDDGSPWDHCMEDFIGGIDNTLAAYDKGSAGV